MSDYSENISKWKGAIQSVNKVIISTHQDPDFDAIGSALALSFYLKHLQIESKVWIADSLGAQFNFLPQLDSIDSEFPKTYDADAIFVLDASDLTRVKAHEKIQEMSEDIPIINIDHHGDNTSFGHVNITQAISSVCELLFHIFSKSSIGLSQDIATCLYAGLIFDTGRFQHANVTADTFVAASKLVESGAKSHEISRYIFEEKETAYFDAIKEAIASMVINEEKRYAYAFLRNCENYYGAEVIDFVRKRKNVDVCLVFREIGHHVIKINLRSSSEFDVSKFARQFGGGGHRKASGITLKGNLDEVIYKISSKLNHELST